MGVGLADVPVLPLDEAFALTAEFKADGCAQKVSLGAGVYRDEQGDPWVLPSVKKVRQQISLHQTPNLDHEYLPIQGSEPFLKLARDLILGESLSPKGNLTSIQTISGTGANHVGAQFLARHLHPKHVFISDPTWSNHHLIWTIAAPNVTRKTYPYYNAADRSLDFEGWVATLEREAVENDVVVLHACAHNPTGLDPTHAQWKFLAELFRRKKLFAFFDSAYQGFATGDLDLDAWAVRHFQEVLFGLEECPDHEEGPSGLCIAQSFAKNFGLYGERVGAFHLSLPPSTPTSGAYSQLLQLTRAEISNPPLFGARIVTTVLSNLELRSQWEQDLLEMASRVRNVRGLLRKEIEHRLGSGSWSHLESQTGMFSYTGLSEAQVLRLKNMHHVYLMRNGRASLSGVNESNVKYIAEAVSEVVSNEPE
ncbi:aspartate aminotransferase [Capronia coronata CBS 617.96]|uniref:Aspartate aminotransferase n=1 Tax=Capronia coronata CBS 617.96 TaxID=1182541 RepID=W9Z4H9_9EURO|nr:aspartate aminotransferase [Capronia coronata CBS 617.96]EXJ96506.1 aspartate aminotransferase [Capronia coronata CBS 617.96]